MGSRSTSRYAIGGLSRWARNIRGATAYLLVVITVASAKSLQGGLNAADLAKFSAGSSSRSPLKTLEGAIPRAVALAHLEQEIEDINVMHKFDRRLERLAMVMPLTDLFDPGVAHFAHEHLQEGDKISFPSSILSELLRKQAEVPWQFEIQLVRRTGVGKFSPIHVPTPEREELQGKAQMPQIASVACSMLDARSPEQFIFIPDWMMKSLRLKPRDIVRYRHRELNKASKIVLQPHASAFLKMSNHQAVMETELRHYSSISRGTTIGFRYRKTLYKFNVMQCIDVDGKSQDAVCVQDSDVATDFQPALDTPAGRRKAPFSQSQDTTARMTKQDNDDDDDDDDDDAVDEADDGWGSDDF